MVHVQQEYDMLRQHCHQLESQLSSSLQEVCYLKQQHLDSQEDLAQLRATVRGTHTHTHTHRFLNSATIFHTILQASKTFINC